MLRTALLSAWLPLLALAQTSFDVNVSNDEGALIFVPDTLTAPAGSKIHFHVYPGDHSVAQSTYNNPCQPSGPDAIYSGFLAPDSGVDSKMFTVTVPDSAPLWLYCSQVVHCQSGIVMVVNPPSSGETLAGYKEKAASASTSTSPSAVHGGVFSPNKAASIPAAAASGASSSSSSSNTGNNSLQSQINKLRKAHGAIMALVVVILLPVGALLMRVLSFRGLVWVHAAWQVTSLLLLTAGFGIGVHQAMTLDILFKGLGKSHTLLGTIVYAFFWLQPLLGLAHHMQFMKKHARTPVSYAHIFLGRSLFVLAIVNGGLGIKVVANLGGPASTGGAANTNTVKIAYAVVAGIVGVVYIGATAFGELRRRKTAGAGADADAAYAEKTGVERSTTPTGEPAVRA